MSMTKRALLTSGATMALAGAALAGQQASNQAEDDLLSHEVLMLEPSGHMMKRKATAKGVEMVQKYGQKVPTAYAMVYRDGNDHYLLTNQQMADGTMLFDHRDEWYERS
jgi:hypothetical protein